METRLISFGFLLTFIFLNRSFTIAQNKEYLTLTEITIDTTRLDDARYVLKTFGKLTHQRSWSEEYDDYSRKFTELRFGSIIVSTYTNKSGRIFTNLIHVTGPNHKVFINNKIFMINDSVSILKNSLPKVYDEYLDFANKNKNDKNMNFFGIPILIFNNYNENETYYGSLKFGIQNGIIKEILVDLRPEGEYD